MNPRFSVVVPAYNREKLVGPTIDSVLAQTFSDYELIVVDDGSTDDTPEVLRSYGTKIKVVRQANQGPEVARDRGIALATGEYVALLDSDDLLWPHALEIYDRIIRACQSPGLILGATTYFEDGQIPQPDGDGTGDIEVFQFRDYLAKDVPVALYGSSVVTKKSIFEQVGGLRQSTPTTFHMDMLDTMLRIGVYGPCVVVKRPPTLAYRVHRTNSIRDIQGVANGVFPVINAERRGQYPGGSSRRFERYACIGGVAWCWFKYALADRQVRIVGKYILHCSPMIVAGALKKIWGRVRGASHPVCVPRDWVTQTGVSEVMSSSSGKLHPGDVVEVRPWPEIRATLHQGQGQHRDMNIGDSDAKSEPRQDKAMKPRFSVVIPAYNRQKLVAATIDSVLAQTFRDYELIVVDDGSTDGTAEVLRSYGARISVIQQANQGPEVARNRGVSAANGEYLAFLDSDDLLLPCALATYERVIRELGSPAVVIGIVTHFKDGQAVRADASTTNAIELLRFRDYLAKDVAISLYGSNVVIKRSILDQAGGLRTSTPTTFYLDIWDMMLRLGTYGPCVLVRRPSTVAYRVHNTNSVRNVEAMVKGISRLIEAERRGQYPGGRSRRFVRYACLGGMSWSLFRYALKNRRPRLGFGVLLQNSRMIMAGGMKKLWCRLRRTGSVLRLPGACETERTMKSENPPGGGFDPVKVADGR